MNLAGAALYAILVLVLIDWRQTLTIARSPDRWRERNPVLAWLVKRAAPQVGLELTLETYFLGAAAVLVFAALFVWAWVPALCLPLQAWCVWNNHRIGIRPSL